MAALLAVRSLSKDQLMADVPTVQTGKPQAYYPSHEEKANHHFDPRS